MLYQHLNSPTWVGIGLLIIRLMIGLTMMGHGCQKLFGWFGGPGAVGFGQWLQSLGLEAGKRFWSVAAGLFELIGGFLFASGIFTALGAGLISAVMVDAIVLVHRKHGFWIDKGGWEYTLVLIVVTIGVGLIGPGRYVLTLI